VQELGPLRLLWRKDQNLRRVYIVGLGIPAYLRTRMTGSEVGGSYVQVDRTLAAWCASVMVAASAPNPHHSG